MSDRPVLLTSESSPFGRITRIARIHQGLEDRVATDIRDPAAAKHAAIAVSPLGKVPVLTFGDGTFLADSRTILRYFDDIAPQRALCPAGPAGWEVATRLALVNGLLDAALLLLYEGRFRPAGTRSENWRTLQRERVALTLAHLGPPQLARADASPDIADIAFAVALEYLDFRFNGTWRGDHPALCGWLERLAGRVEGFHETSPVAVAAAG